MSRPPPIKRQIFTRDLNINHEDFHNDILLAFTNTSPEQLTVSSFNEKLVDLLDRHAPLQSRTVTDRPSAPWMSSAIKEAKADRRRAERRWRSTSLVVHKDIYRHHHNIVRRLIAKARNCFYNKQIGDCSSTKQLYCVTNKLCAKRLDPKFPTTVPDTDLPNAFGQFFQSKVGDIREKLDANPNNSPSYENFEGPKLCDFDDVCEDEVKQIILSSPPKSCCLDPIPTSLLVKHIDVLVPFITILLNTSLRSGIVPDPFKHAVVTPILKKSHLSPNELKNFRPISNLPFISKILEKIVATQLRSHISRHGLFESHQSAYRQFHNTETALLKIQNDLLCAADAGHVSTLALLDLSAAFDTIDHTILIERLCRTFGVSGTVLRWIDSYLVGRTQSVQVKGLRSSSFPLVYGVPQGSVLGPILFILYTQPLGHVIKKHKVNYHMYADDTQLYSSTIPENVPGLMSAMGHCIEDVEDWMIVNKLKMNEEKTEILICDPKNRIENDDISINNTVVTCSVKARNLGVIFSRDLSLDNHVSNLCKLIYCEIRRIKHLSTFLDENSLKTLISAFVLSRIDYCNSLFMNSPGFLFDKLQRLQNSAARLVLRRSRREHVTPMLLRLHWLPIKARVVYKVSVLCFRCIGGTTPSYLGDLVDLYDPPRPLRSGDQRLLKVPKRGSRKFADRSFVHCAPSVWNDLPLALRKLSDETLFKKRLKTYLVQEFLLE